MLLIYRPTLQFFDADHHIEMTLRVLFNDVTHVIRLPRLLYNQQQ